ncbi:MAG TPA: hypothetical protein VF403_09145 [Kofleriaceae bacterium]
MGDPIEERFALLEVRLARLERGRLPALAARLPVADAAALEAKLGTYWLSRFGIVSLITGAAMLIVTYFGALGPFVRVAVGYAMAAVVAWTGLQLARQHKTFGQIVFGGGLAIGYFVTYALHFVHALRVVDNEPIGVGLVAIAIAAIVATAHRMRSETVAGIALFLGLHTGMLSEVTALSLIATTLLAAGAGFFLAVNRWVLVPLSTVVAVYSTHAVLAMGAGVSPELRAAFLGVDFALFSAALLIGPLSATRSLALLGFLNWLGALVLGGYTIGSISQEALFASACGFAIVIAAIAGIAHVRHLGHEIVVMQLGFALITAALALPIELSGAPLIAGWLVLALIAAWVARRTEPRFAVLALVLVLASYGEARVDHDGVLAVLACVLAMFAVERGHADAADSSVRPFAIAGVALGLLQLAMLAIPAGYHTVGWVSAAVALFGIGFALQLINYRWAGFAVLGLTAARLLAVELPRFSPNQRIVTFVLAGVALLVVSYVYARRERRK